MIEKMPSLFPEQTLQQIENAGVIAVLVIDEPDGTTLAAGMVLAMDELRDATCP